MLDFGVAFATRKQTVTAEHLGQTLGDEIWRDVYRPRDPIPRTYIAWEWLIIRTFIATRVVQTLLDKGAADRALYAMQTRICQPTHFKSRHALMAFQGVADVRHQEYLNAFNIWRNQKDEEPLTRALASHVLSDGVDSKEVLELFIRFVGCLKTHDVVLRHSLRSKFNVK